MLHQHGIELRPCILKELGNRPISRHRLTIQVIGRHCVEGVDDRNHASLNRNLFSGQRQITRFSVERGGGVLHCVQHALRTATGSKNLNATATIFENRLEFFGSDPSRFQEDAIGNPHLAEIVHQGGKFDRIVRLGIKLLVKRPRTTAQGHTQAVRSRLRVFLSQCGKQGTRHAQTDLD